MVVIGKQGCAMWARRSSLDDAESSCDGDVSSRGNSSLAANDLAGWTVRPAMHGKRKGPDWPSTAIIEGF